MVGHLKCIYDSYHLMRLFLRHSGTDGQAKFLSVDTLSNWQRHAVPLSIALLLMWRDWVVDEGLYTLLFHIVL